MANNRLGELRRSAVVMTFGPGSVVDFRAAGAPVSAVAAGLEEWDNAFPPAGLANWQRITEPRLQRKLSVGGFRLPPVVDENWRDDQGNPDCRTLVAARFPEWLQCPQCDRLAPASRWSQDPGRAYRYCAGCTRKAPGQRKVFAVPIRFVMACAKGHLDDFPWHIRVGHKADCKKKNRADLYLRSERPGLAGLILSCGECKAWRSMDGVFQRTDLARLSMPRAAAVARRGQRDLRLRTACTATRRIEPVLPRHRVGAQHPAVVGCATGSARGLLEPDCQRKARGLRDIHPHPG